MIQVRVTGTWGGVTSDQEPNLRRLLFTSDLSWHLSSFERNFFGNCSTISKIVRMSTTGEDLGISNDLEGSENSSIDEIEVEHITAQS